LDEWCAVASPDESAFITKIRFNHKKHPKFPASNLNLLSSQFIIRHTPQDILYNVSGFREKNKDLLREEIKITMRSSKLRVLTEMFSEQLAENELDSRSHRLRKFLSSKFRKEMNELVEGLLTKSEQHFIRCIKPNGSKSPLQVDEEIVRSQIKYLGILDTINIKKTSYCVKVKY
jgi:myosin-5